MSLSWMVLVWVMTAGLQEEKQEEGDLRLFTQESRSLGITLSPSLTARYLTGSYGGDAKIGTFQLLGSLAAAYGRFDLSITQVQLTTDAGGSSSPGLGFLSSGATEGASGLGDLYLSAGALLLQTPVQVHLSAGVKFPIADQDLGTGEYDFYLYLTATVPFGDWSVTLRVGRIFMGDPPGVDYEDSTYGAVAVGYRWKFEDPNRYLDARLWLRGQTSAQEGVEDSLEAALTLDYGASRTFVPTFEGAIGLTDGAADWTIAIGFRLNFGL